MARCRVVRCSANTAGLNLSARRCHTCKRRLTLKKKCETFENTTLLSFVVHVVLGRHLYRRNHLCCGVQNSLLNVRHVCNFQAEIVEVEIVGVAIYRPFWDFRRDKSYCHLYGAQGQRQSHLLPMPR
ncbi:hypothetical protein TNCV_2219181 [Trichonephila clavipes]|nr:hypothetical protein TNCV_2219181 [Trichonephila clavipes]